MRRLFFSDLALCVFTHFVFCLEFSFALTMQVYWRMCVCVCICLRANVVCVCVCTRQRIFPQFELLSLATHTFQLLFFAFSHFPISPLCSADCSLDPVFISHIKELFVRHVDLGPGGTPGTAAGTTRPIYA